MSVLDRPFRDEAHLPRAHPRLAEDAQRALLGVALLLSLLISPLLRRLNLHGDLLDLLPRSSQAAQAFASYSKHMVASQELVVLVTCADSNTLIDFAEKYAKELTKLPDVAQVTHRISAWCRF